MGTFARLRPLNLGVRRTATQPGSAPGSAEHGPAYEPEPRPEHEPGDLGHPRIARPVQLLLAIGIDGQGPLSSAAELAEAARTSSLTTDEAVSSVSRITLFRGAAGGFVTGVGGFWLLPVALPINLVEFHVQAARMVGAVAVLRGYDIDDADVRRTVLQTLLGTQRDSPLVTAAAGTRGGAITWRVLRVMPAGVRLLAGKAIGFRLLRSMSELLLVRFGRGVPVLGGIAVAVVDGWNMRRIAAHASVAFPDKLSGAHEAQSRPGV